MVPPSIASFRPFLQNNRLAGVVTLLALNGEIIEEEATGYADLRNSRPIKTSDLFWIASMTKPITATAILMLADEGKLSVEDSVTKYLPAFGRPWVATEKTDDRITLERARRPITIRDLLTHFSGIENPPVPSPSSLLSSLVHEASLLPLGSQPGSRWLYGDSGMNLLGRIVEVITGLTFPDFLEARIFGPLGMSDTSFFPRPDQLERLVKAYVPDAEGLLQETGNSVILAPINERQRPVLPGAGLFSTARDMYRFCQMILNGGIADGRRYLSESIVRDMTTSQTGDRETGFVPGMSFGFGFAVVRSPTGPTAMLTPGTFGHDGVFGTGYWVDPMHKSITILMYQRAKLHVNDEHFTIRSAFHSAAMSVIAAHR